MPDQAAASRVCPRREISPYLSAIPLKRLKLHSKGRIRRRRKREREIRGIYIYIYLSPIFPSRFSSLTWKSLSMELVLVWYWVWFCMEIALALIRIENIQGAGLQIVVVHVWYCETRVTYQNLHAGNVGGIAISNLTEMSLTTLKSLIRFRRLNILSYIIREIWIFSPRHLVFNPIFISHTLWRSLNGRLDS